MSYLLELPHIVARLPGIALDVGWVAPATVGIYYAVLLLLVSRRSLGLSLVTLSRRRRPATSWAQRSLPLLGFRFPAAPGGGLLSMGLAAAILWIAAFVTTDGRWLWVETQR